MLEIIYSILITPFAYFFLKKMIWEDDIFFFYGNFINRISRVGKLGKWISKPLGTCQHCFVGEVVLLMTLAKNGLPTETIHVFEIAINIGISMCVLEYFLNKYKKIKLK